MKRRESCGLAVAFMLFLLCCGLWLYQLAVSLIRKAHDLAGE